MCSSDLWIAHPVHHNPVKNRMGNPPTKKTTLKLENVLGFAFSHLNGEGPYRGSATEVFGVMGF